MIESIKKVTGTELKENSEQLLNNMRKLRHTANDILGSDPLKEFAYNIGGCYDLTINVGGEEYPIVYTPGTVCANCSIEITDDIYDEDNYLGITDDDELLWLALVMQMERTIQSQNERIQELEAENDQLRVKIDDMEAEEMAPSMIDGIDFEGGNVEDLIKYHAQVAGGSDEEEHESMK
ncbi:MAG: hypothetical protein IKU29_01615 [Parabacteroides sp.]|nr:hypothetical protein [Parabacteroides sp.]